MPDITLEQAIEIYANLAYDAHKWTATMAADDPSFENDYILEAQAIEMVEKWIEENK